MSAYLNRVQLIGRITGEPTRHEKDGNLVMRASIAVNQRYKSNGEYATDTQFFDLVFFGDKVNVAAYLEKGTQVYIEGALRASTWNAEDGTKQKSTNIVVNNVQLLGKKTQEEGREEEQ